MSDAAELLQSAVDAAARGDVPGAIELLRECVVAADVPDAHRLLGALSYANDHLDDARVEWEHAFRGYRDAGDLRNAARVAMGLAELHSGSLGNRATGSGWLERARRLLEQAGPCVEWGYWELALIACDRPDVVDLERSATRALELATEYRDVALEVRALADGGLALVSQGRVREGFDRLDEALAVLSTGEVTDLFVVGTAFCALLSSCERAGDAERATEWIRMVQSLVLQPRGGRPRVLSTHCHLALGGVLCAVGRWTEAEEALLASLGPTASASRGHRVEATTRLAELRLYQGRVDEAAELLAPIEDDLAAAAPVASLHLARGEPALAAAVLRRAVTRLVGDVLRGAPLLAALVEAELARGDVDAARGAARLLRAMTEAVDAPVVAGFARLAAARVAVATGDVEAALDAFDAALRSFTAAERPVLVAATQLELADAHVARHDDEAAVVAARAAHTVAERLDAAPMCDRAAALLRRLGATPPRSAASAASRLTGLTARESEVLDGLRRGDSNAQIAARLYLSPKTVEHHVSRVLAKLGVRTRAEAAAVAAAAAATGEAEADTG